MTLRLKIVLSLLSTAAALSILVRLRRRFPGPVERALESLRARWMAAAKAIGHAQTVVILTAVYFTDVAATSIVARLAGRDPLGLRGPGGWLPRKRATDTLETLKRQF